MKRNPARKGIWVQLFREKGIKIYMCGKKTE